MTVDAKQDTAQFTDEAIQLGHFSKFVRPGALHIAATSGDPHGIEYVAFQNPDKTLAMVVRNSSSQAQTLTAQTSHRTSFTTTCLLALLRHILGRLRLKFRRIGVVVGKF